MYNPPTNSMDKPDYTPQQFSVYVESDTEEFHEIWADDSEESALAICETLYGWTKSVGNPLNAMYSIVDNFSNSQTDY